MTREVAVSAKYPSGTAQSLPKQKKRWRADTLYTNLSYVLMIVPGAIWLFLFAYLPMPGIVMAFKDYRLSRPPEDSWIQNRFIYSLIESPWVGLDNFRYLILPTNIENTLMYVRNTIFYNLLFIVVGLVLAVALAVIINELTNQFFAKFYHSILFLPYFISWIVVAYVVYALGSSSGIINSININLGLPPIEVYKEEIYWPFIFLVANIWKYTGNGSIIYLATIASIPRELYEAAAVDGAGKWHQFKSITLPHLMPVIVLLQILAIGRILGSDFDMFYTLPNGAALVKDVTYTLDVFVYSMLRSATPLGYPAAAAFLQSLFGFFLILITNFIVRRIRPDLALF
ncbi:ABC transporter permease subunit [bacterium]|nr:ABC transporter permease subunit [bacterium]